MLQRRLASLRAAPTLADMSNVPGKCHQLTADRKGQFAISVLGGERLIFEPDHDPLPLGSDGGIDRNSVTRIVIMEVTNYHGN